MGGKEKSYKIDMSQDVHECKMLDFETKWIVLKEGITKLVNLLDGKLEQDFTYEEYIELYTIIYNLCTQPDKQKSTFNKYIQLIYDRYKEIFQDYINSKVLPILQEKQEEFMLKEFVTRWKNHKYMVRWLSKIFSYVDRSRNSTYLAHLSTSSTGILTFHDMIYVKMKNKITTNVIALINRERQGEQIDWTLLKNVLEIFVEVDLDNVNLYETDFETYLLQNTVDYYSRKGAFWIVEDSFSNYMVKVEECLKREKERVGHYLHANSEVKLLEKIQFELLKKYKTQLLEKMHSCCNVLFRNDKVDDLARIYRMFSKILEELKPLASIFKEHVMNEGISLVKQADDATTNNNKGDNKEFFGAQDQAFVQKVIGLHKKYLQHVTKCFGNHNIFHKALKEAFIGFCNKRVAGITSVELLATFCDIILKTWRSEKGLSDEEIDDILGTVVKLLEYINDKDLFVEFSRKNLARRLFFDKNGDNDREVNFLSKMKHQWGRQFTSKMESMVIDYTMACENQTDFQEYLMENTRSNLNIDINVIVLSARYWPTYKSFDLVLPHEMVKCIEVFKEFYGKKTKNRKLTWIYSLGTCIINGNFDTKPIELIVSTFQAAALLLFNDEERLSYKDIKSQLNLTDYDVVRLLHSLSCMRYKILNKNPNTKIVGQSDTFVFNSKFTDKMKRIKIPLPPLDEKKKVINNVDQDRRFTIDASLVRIMKSRKQLNHQQLVMECIEQCKQMFQPDVKLIKKRIEELITRDYLEHDIDNPTIYKYIA